MSDLSPVDACVKTLLREFPGVIARLAGLSALSEQVFFEDTAINLPERRADHVLVLGSPDDPKRGALYVEYQLRPNPALIPEWEYKRCGLRIRLQIDVVLLVLYLEKGDRSTFPDSYIEVVGGVSNEFRFTSVRLWEHAERIRNGELWELAPLLVLCEDNPGEETLREEFALISNSGAPAQTQADLLALALRVGERDLPRSMLEAIFREAIPMIQGASIIDDWIAEGRAEGEAKGKLDEAQRLLTRFLGNRFGALPPALTAHIAAADAAACEELLLRAGRAESLRELGW